MVAEQEYGELFLEGEEELDLDRPLPEHLVNVDFSDEARKIGRQMGCLIRPRTEKPGDHCPLFGERFKDLIIPRSDWLDILEQEKPNYAKHKFWQYDQNGEGTCFLAGTLIRMADGSCHPIESLRLGQKVLTAEGNIGRIVRLQARPADRITTLKMWGHRHLRATPEHPILTKRGYVPIGELKKGDWVAMPRYAPESAKVLQTAEHCYWRQQIKAKTGRRNYFLPGKPTPRPAHFDEMPDLIDLDYSFGRLIGLFLAEGSTSRQKAIWSFGADEEDSLVDETVHLLEKIGVTASVRHRTAQNVIQVVAYGVHWAQLFESLCGHGALGKGLHPSLAAGPKEFLTGVLTGWLDGDGWYDAKRDAAGGITISHQLALNMFDIASAIGKRVYINEQGARDFQGRRRKKVWTITVYDDDASERHGRKPVVRTIIEEGVVWRKVRGVQTEEKEAEVYNLEVSGDHSFVAEGVGVHNCTSNATAGCISYCWSKQFGKQFGIAPAPLSCYKRCARGPNTGSTTGCNLRCARDTGMLLIDNASNRKIMEGMGLDTSHMMRAVGYRQASFPRGWEETAGFFRIDEYYEINSVDEFFTALLYGYDILYGRAGHAIHGVDLVYRNRDFYCKYDNSWGRWGDKGFGYDSLDYVRRRGGAYGAYAVKHVRTPDEQIQKLMGIPEFAQAV